MTPEEAMRRALELAASGYAAPNPCVGCVIVQEGVVVGEGFSAKSGGPHAEIRALAAAGTRARGADVFVTLEPCNHHGKTPPCSLALIGAGVRKVWIGAADPNPVAQGGAVALEEHGVEVAWGPCQAEAQEIHRAFLVSHRRGSPYVVLKIAMTQDAVIALPEGQGRWITSETSREEGRKLRARLGSVLVGSGTVLAEDPLLTSRIDGADDPVRIVLDKRGRLSPDLKVFAPDGKFLWLVERPTASAQTEWKTGTVKEALEIIWSKGIWGVLVEGGPHVWTSFIEQGLVDESHLFVSQRVVGEGAKFVLPQGFDQQMTVVAEKCGPDMHYVTRPQDGP